MMFWIIVLIVQMMQFNPSRSQGNCTWSNVSIAGGPRKSVNSTGRIQVWTIGLNYYGGIWRSSVIWKINGDEVARSNYEKNPSENDTITLVPDGILEEEIEARFLLDGTKMSSNLTVLLHRSYNAQSGTIEDGRCLSPDNLREFKFIVDYCSDFEMRNTTDQDAVYSITANNNQSVYKQGGKCSCEKGDLYLVNGTASSGTVWCNETAVWEGCERVQCWSAPTNLSIEKKSFCEGQFVDVKCTFTEGFPFVTNTAYFIDDEEVYTGKTKLNSSHHMKPYFCTVRNNYTSVRGPDEMSDNQTMIVFFGPEPLSGVKELKILVNHTELATFTFRANDVTGNVTAQLNGPGIVTPVSNTTINETATYIFSYNITVNSEKDQEMYVFTAYTEDPNGSATIDLKVVSYDVTTSMPTTSSQQNGKGDDGSTDIIPIAAGCGAAGLVIIILVIGLIVYRKRKGKDDPEPDIREERDNPLYGSTPGPPPYDEYASVDKKNKKKKKEKEEKVNPLYEGTSTNENMVEDAYAAVDKKAKKGKKDDNTGKENSAFADEATYAAVIKPKKKKNVEPQPDVVYSAVQKKRKDDRPDLQS